MTQQLFAIIGHPIGQARSPTVFNARLTEAGSTARMIPLDVAPADFETALAGLRVTRNFAGLVVTVPHKIAAAELAAVRSPRVEAVGAANLLRPVAGGWEADLSDGIGFLEGLRTEGHHVAGTSVAVIGAGGAGLAIAEALLSAGATVSISDIDVERAALAVSRLASFGEIRAEAPGLDHRIVVNATPVGMDGDTRLPVAFETLGPDALVAEAVMKPPVTPFLSEAALLGHPTHEGRHMLDGQVPAIWNFLQMGPVETDLA